MDRHFVAGFDGSADARAAAHWAAAEAVSRDVDLIVVTSYRAPKLSTSSGTAQALSARALIERDHHLTAIEALAEELRGAHPGLAVSGRVIEGPPRRVLIEQAAHADLLVIGARGSADDSHSPPGTVARAFIHASPCPTVFVPAETRPAGATDRSTVTVAVDGSGKSMRALDWAVEAAVHRRTPLTIVHMWRGHADDAESEQHELARARAARVLEDAADVAKQRGAVVVHQRLLEGDAARHLPAVTDDAELFVVGSRVDSGLHVSTVGSVAEATVEGARCPVAVVTASAPAPDQRRSPLEG